MKLKDASFLIIIYSLLMSNNKVQSPLTDMINIFMTLYEILFIVEPSTWHENFNFVYTI
jgi:hypothetical protein